MMRSITWLFIATIFLLQGKLTIQSECLEDDIKCSNLLLTSPGLLKVIVCPSGDCMAAVDGVADGSLTAQWMMVPTSGVAPIYDIHFKGKFRVNKIRLKQLSTDYRQIKGIYIGNVDVSFFPDQIELGIQGDEWQTFRFPDVNTDSLRLSIQTFYTDDALAIGFQELEIYAADCGKNQMCERVTLPAQGTDVDDVIYPLNGKSMMLQVSYYPDPTIDPHTLNFTFMDEGGYGLPVMLASIIFHSTKIELVLEGGGGSNKLDLAFVPKPNTDYVFFFEFTTAGTLHFGLGVEPDRDYLSRAFNSAGVPRMGIKNKLGSRFRIGVCGKRRECYADAAHHWPMDNVVGEELLDVAGNGYATIYNGHKLLENGPSMNTGFSTSAISLNADSHQHIIATDFAATHVTHPSHWIDGWTFECWLRLDGSRTGTDSFITVPGYLAVKQSVIKGLTVSFLDSVNTVSYVVSSTIHMQPGVWYLITITWDSVQKLTVYHDLTTRFLSVEQQYSGTLASASDLTLGCPEKAGVFCEHMSFANVVYWDKALSWDKLREKFRDSGYKQTAPGAVDVQYGTVSNTKLSASSQRFATLGSELSDIPDYISGPIQTGSWTPGSLDYAPFLQLDLNFVREVTEIGVRGAPINDEYVTEYTISYKESVSPWHIVPYIATQSTEAWLYNGVDHGLALEALVGGSAGVSPTVLQGTADSALIVSNVLVTPIKTRCLRFYPTSWVGDIAMEVEVFSTGQADNYRGCFAATTFPYTGTYDGEIMTPGACIQVCEDAGNTYAFLRAGSFCGCGNTLPSPTVEEHLCTLPCTGNPGLLCGGDGYDAVYEVFAETLSPAFTLTLPTSVNMHANFEVSVSTLPESTYQVNFGDGVVMLSFTETMVYSYATPGTYTVKVTAMTGQYGEPHLVEAEGSIDVTTNLAVSFETPFAVETDEVFQSTIYVKQAPDCTFDIDFFDSKSTITDTLKATAQFTVGDDVDDTAVSLSTPGVYVYRSSSFTELGNVQAWEVLATKAGIIQLLIVRPICMFNVSEPYIKADGSASIVADCNVATIVDSNIFCATSEVSSAGTCLGSGPAASLATTHEIVHQYIAFVHAGRNLFYMTAEQFAEQLPVAKGYQLGFGIVAELGAHVAMTTTGKSSEWQQFNGIVGSVGLELDESSATVIDAKYHVKAYYTVQSVQVIAESYSSVGEYSPQIVFNCDGTTTTFVGNVLVSESIEGGEWTVTPDDYIATNATLDIVINALTKGYNVTITVVYEEGVITSQWQDYVTEPVSQTHVYPTRGLKPLSVIYSNAISSRDFGRVIHVQDIVMGLELIDPIAVVATSNETEITWFLPQGSHVRFSIDLGDETMLLVNESFFDIDAILATYISHVYATPGEYDVNITVYNDVSSITLLTVAAVEDLISDTVVDVVHVARDIEVDETITFAVSLGSGTSPVYYIDFGDGEEVYSWDNQIQHAYTYFDIFTVNVTVYNNVSIETVILTVQVHKYVEPLLDFEGSAAPTNHTDPSSLMLTITNGTDFNCTWDFGDGTTGTSEYADFGNPVMHTYAEVNVYLVSAQCVNRLYNTSFSFLVIVQTPILDFVAPELEPVIYTESFTSSWTLTGTNATYNITFENEFLGGELFLLQNEDLDLNSDFTEGSFTVLPGQGTSEPGTHLPGVYYIRITVWNHVTPPKFILRQVIIDQPIENAALAPLDNLIYWEVNKTVTLVSTMSLGTNVTLTTQFGDGVSSQELIPEYFPPLGANTLHVYITDGPFYITMVFSNSVSEVTLQLTLWLEYPADMILLSDSPLVASPGATVSFTLEVNPGKEPPTNGSAQWHFGDGSSSEILPFAFTMTHEYATHGWFIVTVTLSNNVKTINVTGFADVQRVIVGASVTAVHSAGDAGEGALGKGPDGDIFPMNYNLRFLNSVEDGTNVTYSYDHGDGSSGETQESSYEHKYDLIGSVTCTVMISNSVSNTTMVVTFVLEAVVQDVTITNNQQPLVIGNAMPFSLSLGVIGTKSCCYVYMDDTTRITFRPVSTPACLLKPDFSTDVREFSGNVVNFTYTFPYDDDFNVEAECANDASSVIGTVRATIVTAPCFYPKAAILECSPNISAPRQIMRSIDVDIPNGNKIDCEAAVRSQFQWTVSKYEPDLPPITPPGHNESTYFHEIVNASGISDTFPRFFAGALSLEYGVYLLHHNICMVGPQGIWDKAFCYFEIVKSPLIAIIAGGSMRTSGHGKNITFDATASGDPDVEVGNRTGIQVAWFCKRTDDDYVFPDNPLEQEELPITPRDTSDGSPDLGGCFGHGPGRIAINDYTFILNTAMFIIDVSYTFRFCIIKDTRIACFDSAILLVAGDPPQLSISCLQNCFEKLNPDEKSSLQVNCDSCTPQEKALLNVNWEVEESGPEEVQQETGDEERKKRAIPEDIWELLQMSEIARSEPSSKILVVREKALRGGRKCKIRVSGRIGQGAVGVSEWTKVSNSPPSGGTCVVTPIEGYTLTPIFTTKCDNWVDTDEPIKYSFKVQTSENEQAISVYDGLDSARSDIQLPLGDSDRDHMVTIICIIKDALGASTTITQEVKVTAEEISAEDFNAKADQMTSENGPLGRAIAEGNINAMLQISMGVTSMLDVMAEPEPEPEPEVVVTNDAPAAPRNPAELEQERLAKEAEEAEKKRIEEELKKQRIALRETMISSMASIEVNSVSAIDQTSACLGKLVSNPDEISIAAQNAAAGAAVKMAAGLFQSTGKIAGSVLTKAVAGVASVMDGTGTASSAAMAAANSSDPVAYAAAKKQAKGVADAKKEVTNNLLDALSSGTVLGEAQLSITTKSTVLATVKKSPEDLASGGIVLGGGGGFNMPGGMLGNDSEPVDISGDSSTNNLFNYDESAKDVSTGVFSMKIRNASGHVIPVANLTEPIAIAASTGLTADPPTNSSVNYKQCAYIRLEVAKNDTSIHFKVMPQQPNDEFILYLKRGVRPARDDYDYMQVIPDDSPVDAVRPKDRNVFYVSNVQTNRTTAGVWFLGICFNGTLEPVYETTKSGLRQLVIPPYANFSFSMFQSGCKFWDESIEQWSGAGCEVGPQTTVETVQCLCTHLTSFAGDFFVMPNAIDWSKISLDNLFSNPTVFAVVMAIFGLYVICMIWARKKDKKDLEQIGTTPLPCNDPRDNYLYEIVFFTGHSPKSGTSANVYMILEGTVDETAPRHIKDPERKKFTKSGVDTFLLAVPSSLGRLKNINIWHDNSGDSPGWFLQRIMIQDMQSDKKTWFLCDKWLDVAEDDGEIQRTLGPATRDDLTSFNLLFSTEARKSLTDSHLWFSVIKRPPRSTFTRCQRLSCCLTIILTTMLANAMFFQTDSTSSTGTELSLGPISFSVKQISIAITSSMVVLPANILIVTLFRKAGPKEPKKPKEEKSDMCSIEEEGDSGDEHEEENEEETGKKEKKEKDKKKKKKKGKEKYEEQKEEVIKVEDENEELRKEKKKKGKYPHWVVYVAYAVVALASLVSATFTVFYGLTFGETKSQKWIMTMMISFWQDVLISQPLKVFAAATFFALVIKNPDKVGVEEDEQKKEGSELKEDEERLHGKDEKKSEEEELSDIKKMAFMPKPPDPVKLEEMRQFKLKQKLMYKILKEIGSYIIFVLILLTVAYGNRDPRSHEVNNALTSYFMSGTFAGKLALNDISNINTYYKYLRTCLLASLKPDFWYGPYDKGAVTKIKDANGQDIHVTSSPGPNGTTIHHQVYPYPNGFTADRANAWLVGTPRIRQLRVTDKGCVFPKGVDHLVGRCSHPYSYDYEDEGYYEEGWVPMNKSKIKKVKNDKWFKSPWSYKTGWQLKGTPYWGFFHTYWSGGFVAELGASYEAAYNDSMELERLNWLDGKTRAIFFEFTVYNPFTNFFAVVNILVEILATGGYYPFPYISTTRLYRYVGAEAMVIMGLEVVFFAYLLYYIKREVKELRTVGKRAYFCDLWNYFDILVISFSILTIVFYFMRMVATKIVISRYLAEPFAFVNFNYVVALDELVTSFMAISVFVSFLKFLRLLRFNSRIGMLASVIKACMAPLASFFLLFIVVFCAYTQFAFLTFGQDLYDYSSFDQCLANMLGMTLGAFDFDGLVGANRIWGPIFFFTYILVMVMILMNVFLSIINDTFVEVNADVSLQSSDSDIADFMTQQFMATVKRTGNTIKPIYKEPKDTLGQNLDDIEDISESVTLVMRSMCLESIRHTSWFSSQDKEETEKKRQILELIMLTGENFTESEVCDAIPVLDTILAKYSVDELKEITRKYQAQLVCEEKEEAEVEVMEDGDSIDSEGCSGSERNSEDDDDENDDDDGDSRNASGSDDGFDHGGPRTDTGL